VRRFRFAAQAGAFLGLGSYFSAAATKKQHAQNWHRRSKNRSENIAPTTMVGSSIERHGAVSNAWPVWL
jgi:hypothetical protein